ILNIHDAGDTADNTGVLTFNTLTGLSPAAVTYVTVEDLNVHLGLGADILGIQSTAATTDTVVDDAGGPDVITVSNAASTLHSIDGLLTIDAGPGDDAVSDSTGTIPHDTLIFSDLGDTADNAGVLASHTITGFGLPRPVTYWSVGEIVLSLGSGDDNVFVESTHATLTTINTGDETPVVNQVNDTINIDTISGPTTLNAGGGNDLVRVNYDQAGRQTFRAGIGSALTLHGQAGSDRYEIGLSGLGSSLINVYDQSPSGDLGVDSMSIYGTQTSDFFLFRPGMIAAIEVDADRNPVSNGRIERVNYDSDLNGTVGVFGRDGDDTFVFDDTSSAMSVYGDAGNDTFQIGQIYQSPRDVNAGLAPEDVFPTTLITRGYLSNGTSEPLTAYGGAGNDSFNVYHTSAETFLYGEEDDDSFRVRAFVKVDPNDPKKPYTNINGGQGADFIEYAVNAPINIEGGDGYDTLTVVGTEFGDDFMVASNGIFGAGLPIRYAGIEKVVVDGMEGNDTFFIDSTGDGVQVELFGGLGSDTFNVDGGTEAGVPIYVVGTNLGGHSGIIENVISQSGADYQNLFVEDVSAVVADSDAPGIIITLKDTPMRAVEGGGAVLRYEVVLTRPPEEDVQVTASPSGPKESDLAAGAKGIVLSTAAALVLTNGNPRGVTLVFTKDNWANPQTVYIAAPDDLVAEGTQDYVIQHTVKQGASADDGGAYDKLKVASLAAKVVDNDVASVIVTETLGSTVVAEERTDAPFNEDTYQVVLSKQPASDVTVAIAADGQVVVAGGTTLTFTTANWNSPQTVRLTAATDTAKEGFHYSRITHEITSDPSAFFNVSLTDVVRGLADAINGDVLEAFTVTVSGDTLTIERDTPFTILADSPAGALSPTAVAKVGSVWQTTVAVSGLTGHAQRGDTWTITLDGKEYAYVAGRNGEAVYVAPVDVEVVDTQVPDVLVTQTGGETHVTEPTSYQVIGTGQVTDSAWTTATITFTGTGYYWETWSVTLSGKNFSYSPTPAAYWEGAATIAGSLAAAIDATAEYSATVTGATITISSAAGQAFVPQCTIVNPAGAGSMAVAGVTASPDSFVADFGSAIMGETDLHDSLSTAQSLDAGRWSLGADPDVANATVTPHLTVVATGDNTIDYYAFRLDAASAASPITAVFDIDYGFEFKGGEPWWGSKLMLYRQVDAQQTVLIAEGTGVSDPSGVGAGGSTYWLDDFLAVELTEPGTYYLQVSNWLPWWSYWTTGYYG
ncbi:MAG: hypothetical protein WC713_09980, partial [Candidatus Methylomirabilota bacterium]